MRFLVLGARAPASLEWSRSLARAGHQVWVADSLRLPLARFSRSVRGYHCLPPPRQQPVAWAAHLFGLVEDLAIDYCIPTCEEVFFLAWARPWLPPACQAFCSNLPTLDALHNKARLDELSQHWPIRTPQSRVLVSREQVAGLAQESHQWVFKPTYSRFATRTLISPTPAQLTDLRPSTSEPWLAQRVVRGREFCSLSLFTQGCMRGHCLYQPRHRVGQGAGIYFDPVDSKDIHDFLRDLGLMLGFNGQLGMDFILDEQGTWWLLEANPRATSGLHLLPDAARCFEARAPNMIMDSSRAPAMITLAMFIYAGRALGQSGFWRDFFNARDVVWNRRDPLPTLAQPLALLELWIAAHRHQTDLLSASTHDIAWNGEALPNLSDAWRD